MGKVRIADRRLNRQPRMTRCRRQRTIAKVRVRHAAALAKPVGGLGFLQKTARPVATRLRRDRQNSTPRT